MTENNFNEHHPNFLQHLRRLNIQVRQQLEQAETLVPQINRQLESLTELELLPAGLVLTGRLVLRQPYTENPWGIVSERLFQAALTTPHGIGIVEWDSEDFCRIVRDRNPATSEFLARFTPFERLPLALRGRLLVEGISLTELLISTITPAPF